MKQNEANSSTQRQQTRSHVPEKRAGHNYYTRQTYWIRTSGMQPYPALPTWSILVDITLFSTTYESRASAIVFIRKPMCCAPSATNDVAITGTIRFETAIKSKQVLPQITHSNGDCMCLVFVNYFAHVTVSLVTLHWRTCVRHTFLTSFYQSIFLYIEPIITSYPTVQWFRICSHACSSWNQS